MPRQMETIICRMRFSNFRCYQRILLSKKFLRTVYQSRRNVLADNKNKPPVAGPYMAEFDITYRCNCRCKMCRRWDCAPRETLAVSDYRSLAEEFDAMAVHQISIAGGEPLLRKDVFEIIKGFADRGQSVNLCTNGILLEKYLKPICQSGATCVTVSLDGASASVHDAIRGIEGSFASIKKGIHCLLAIAFRKRPIVRVRMTVSNANQHEIRAFFDRWDGVADDVLLQPVHHCADSFYTGMSSSDLCLNHEVLASELKQTPLARDSYLKTFMDSLRFYGNYPDYRCFAGVLMARIDPWGNVYPCLEQHVRAGNIKDRSFKSVWQSSAFNDERHRLRTKRDCKCWYNNTALIGYYGNLLNRTTFSRSCSGSRFDHPFPKAIS
ncbi:MAG: radical SAM protein [Desulfobacteraceae bacterium]|nr:radical SAM protein [Desulfobacteraceae bacterium]